jgi:hypothetical protein
MSARILLTTYTTPPATLASYRLLPRAGSHTERAHQSLAKCMRRYVVYDRVSCVAFFFLARFSSNGTINMLIRMTALFPDPGY